MSQSVQFDRQRFKAVIHFVCANVDPVALGRPKLHRILYLADMLTFLHKGVPLTGAQYQTQQFGPAARHLTWAIDELCRDGALQVRHEVAAGTPRSEFHSLREPDRTILGDDDRALLSEVMTFVTVRQVGWISDLNHDAAMRSTDLGENIPYFTAYLLVPCEVTDEDIAWGEKEAGAVLAAA